MNGVRNLLFILTVTATASLGHSQAISAFPLIRNASQSCVEAKPGDLVTVELTASMFDEQYFVPNIVVTFQRRSTDPLDSKNYQWGRSVIGAADPSRPDVFIFDVPIPARVITGNYYISNAQLFRDIFSSHQYTPGGEMYSKVGIYKDNVDCVHVISSYQPPPRPPAPTGPPTPNYITKGVVTGVKPQKDPIR